MIEMFSFRKAWQCWQCGEMRACLKVKVWIDGKERQRMVCADCLIAVCKECIEKEEKDD